MNVPAGTGMQGGAMVATGYTGPPEPEPAAPILAMASEPGTRWYYTASPFDAELLGQVGAGDRFTYPVGHASALETYRWDGTGWQFDRVLDAIPAVALAVVDTAAAP